MTRKHDPRRRRGRPARTGRGYRGPDRRRRESPPGLLERRSWLLAGALLCAAVVVLGFVSETRFGTSTLVAVAGLRSAALVLAVVLAATALLDWRASGEVRGCRVSTAAWLLAAAAIIDLAHGTAPVAGAAGTLRLTLSVCAAVWVAWAYLGPDIDTSTRPVRDLVAAVTAAVAAWALLSLLPPAFAAPMQDVASTMHLLAAATWAAAAVIALARVVRIPSVLLGWVAWLALALAFAEFARFTALIHATTWHTTASGLRTVGLLLAAIGGTSSLAHRAVARRSALHVETLRHAEADRRRHDGERDRVHEVRNALMAIEGASLTLHRYGGDLPPEERARLADAMAGGFAHLRDLLEASSGTMDRARLDAIVARRVALARGRGIPAVLSGERELEVRCPPVVITQVLDNLVENAIRYADAERAGIEVHLGSADGQAEVVVRDHGPGIPVGVRDAIFVRGVRLTPDHEGEGVGLPLARQLIRQHGGDLTVTNAPAGGARFVLSLPLVGSDDPADAAPPGPAEGEHGVEVRQGELGTSVREPCDATSPGGRTIVEGDDHRGRDVRSARRHHRDVRDDHATGIEHDDQLDLAGEQSAQALGEEGRSGRQRDAHGRVVGTERRRSHTSA
jgi:signal transduction histidine kinase